MNGRGVEQRPGCVRGFLRALIPFGRRHEQVLPLQPESAQDPNQSSREVLSDTSGPINPYDPAYRYPDDYISPSMEHAMKKTAAERDTTKRRKEVKGSLRVIRGRRTGQGPPGGGQD